MIDRTRCHRCHALLARDNRGTLCGPCEVQSITRGTPPLPPPGLWDRADIQDAIRDRHIGRLFRAFRKAHTPPIPQETLAEWVQLTQGQVSIIERARKPVTDMERLERWCDAINVPKELRWFRGPATPLPGPGRSSSAVDDGVLRLQRALRNPSSVDLVTVAHLRQRVQDLDQRYDRVPSTTLLPDAGQALGHVDILAAHASGRIAKDLRLVKAEAATLMGQLTWDASQRKNHRAPVAYLDQAVAAANDIGDPSARGYALLRKAYIALYGERNPRAGLSLTEQTSETVNRFSDALSGLADLHAAEAHAMLGDTRACEKSLSQADTHFGRIAPSDIAAHLYSPHQFDRLAGSCYLFLGDHKRAEHILARAARSLRSPSKSGALVLANLSLSHLHEGDLEAATDALHRALDVVEVTRGGGGLNLVAGVGRALRPWRTHPAVQSAYDRLLSLMAAA